MSHDDTITTIKVKTKFAYSARLLAGYRRVSIAEAMELLMQPMREEELKELAKRRVMLPPIDAK